MVTAEVLKDTSGPPGPLPGPAPAPPPQPPPQDSGMMARDRWDALVVLLILATLALVFYIAVTTYRASTADAAAVLGTVIPAIGTVGAAAFGVATGVRAGQQTGGQQANDAFRRAAEQEQVAARRQQ
jgi:hypothetical protein